MLESGIRLDGIIPTSDEIPAFAQGCPGNESVCRRMPGFSGANLLFSGCDDSGDREPDMRYRDSIFASLLKPISRAAIPDDRGRS
jgi:hypothetical protein